MWMGDYAGSQSQGSPGRADPLETIRGSMGPQTAEQQSKNSYPRILHLEESTRSRKIYTADLFQERILAAPRLLAMSQVNKLSE